MASRLKQSNLTSLSTAQKKTQEKSLEEQVYEMPIENIEAERLHKTFLRICGDKVNVSQGTDKESWNKKPYLLSYSDCPSTRKTSSRYSQNSISPTANQKSISGSGKSMKTSTAKSISMNSPSCTNDASSIRPDSNPETSLTSYSSSCTISPAVAKSQSRTLSNSSTSAIPTPICYSCTFPKFSETDKKLKTDKKEKSSSRNT